MPQDLIIRSETGADTAAIAEVTVAAFASLELSDHNEQHIIAGLRAAGALTLSLVATLHGQVIGQIAFSPLTLSDGTGGWYGLGPVSVLPAHQRQGVGRKLVRRGLERLQALGANGCCLVGHPEYYSRFGFENPEGLGVEGVPPQVFFALPFGGEVPRGLVQFHEAFGVGE